MNKLKLGLAALGLSAALVAGPAAAAVSWSYPTSLFQDDLIDFLWTEDAGGNLIPDSDLTIDQGDILISVFEIQFAGGDGVAPEELTGVAALQAGSVSDQNAAGLVDIFFSPYTGGLDAVLALGSTDETVTGGGAGGGAIFAMWLDPTPNLEIEASNVNAGTVSCDSLSLCIDQAVDGDLFQVIGFDGDPDEIWAAFSVDPSTADVLNKGTGSILGFANANVSMLDNQSGQELASNAVPTTLTTPGGDGFADVVGSGPINGGGRDGLSTGLSNGLVADGGFATGDFQFLEAPIPEPGTMALLATGLLGFGAAQRRRRKANKA